MRSSRRRRRLPEYVGFACAAGATGSVIAFVASPAPAPSGAGRWWGGEAARNGALSEAPGVASRGPPAGAGAVAQAAGQSWHSLVLCGVAGLVAGVRRSRPKRTHAAARSGPNVAGPLDYIEQPPSDLREQRLKAKEELFATGAEAWPAPANDRLLRAARGEPVVGGPPKWMMRQAGRYLPEYREVLRHSDFFSVCRSPALAAEITLQPYRRFDTLDALIIFSDILVVPVAMGMGCTMDPSSGPRFDWRIVAPEDLDRLVVKPDINETLGYVFDAIFWTRQRAENSVPVIGFSGAPWTLMGYMVEGGSSKSFDRTKRFLYEHPEASRRLLGALRDVIVEYLVGQFDAGAPLLQVFDSNGGDLPPKVYEEFCVPDLEFIAAEVKRRRPAALLTIFPKGADISSFSQGSYDVVGVDWNATPSAARRAVPGKTLQGNLDPNQLYAPPNEIRAAVHRMVGEFGPQRLIANLGHGMLATLPVEGAEAFIDAVDSSA